MDLELFTQFRLVFGVILAILVLFLILSLIPKGRDTMITFFSVLAISITHLAIATALLIVENSFLEDFTLDGDQMTFYMFIGILVLAILNPVVYKLRNKSRRRRSYSFK